MGPAGPSGAGAGALFKTGTGTASLNSVPTASGPGATIASVTFTAPAAGTVYAQGSGYCNGVAAAGQNLRFEIATTANTIPYNLPYLFITEHNGGPANQTGFNASKTIAVAAGTQTVYLNGVVAYGPNPSGVSCNGNLTVFFSTTSL